MGRKLDLSGLTDDEADHVLQVVQRDMQLRKTEEIRLNEMRQSLVKEGSRCLLLSRQRRFNERCCIRCCSVFSFLLNPKRSCPDCGYSVCKRCCTYNRRDEGWLCSACQKSRLLKIQSLEWFYNNVRRRFERFGSAMMLKNLYRRHGALTEFTEGSTYEEECVYNEGSAYESDTTFYKQSEEHSMKETVRVAMRVAEEVIDEAIFKAESQTDSQERQQEAYYLREHRVELIEELATTIIQKIVQRRTDRSEMKSGVRISADQAARDFSVSLRRSHSAFCLLEQQDNIVSRPLASSGHALEMKKEGTMPVQAFPTWRSVDRLDNSMLQSPDGNWIAYQNTLQSRPSLLTRRKSLVYSVLEKESGVVSAYDEMGSETETETDGVWGAALQELRLKMSANNQLSYPESYSRQSTLPLDAKTQQLADDTESPPVQDGLQSNSQKALLTFMKKKMPLDHRRPSSARRPCIMDINFNPRGAESSEDGLEDSGVKRSRRRRKSKREDADCKVLSPAVPDFNSQLMEKVSVLCGRRLSDQALEADASDTATPDILSSGSVTPEPFGSDLNDHGRVNHRLLGVVESLDQELRRLTSEVREIQLSSTEDELDRLEHQMMDQEDDTRADEADEAMEDATVDIEFDAKERLDEHKATFQPITTERLEEDKLTSKLRELTSQVSETQLSSTEDELDRFECEIGTEVTNQPIVTEMLDQLVQYHKKRPNHVENMVEKAEEERSEREKRPEQHISEQNVSKNKMQMSDKMTTGSQKQSHPVTDAQCEMALKRTEKTKSQRQVQGEERSYAEFEQSRAEHTKTVRQIPEQSEALSSKLTLSGFISEEAEFDRIIDSIVEALDDMEEEVEAFYSEGIFIAREESEAEKLEMMESKEEEENVTECLRWKMEDSVEFERLVVGSVKVQKKEGQSSEVIAVESNTEDTAWTEDNECKAAVKSSENRVLNMDADKLDNLVEKREQQWEPVTQNSSGQEDYLSPDEICKKFSAASLRSITTEVLKVLNAAEDLILASVGDEQSHPDHSDLTNIPPAEAKRLDEQLGRLEENVYVAAGTAFGLEADLGDLEECARSISGSTSEGELAYLEDQVASAAAHVQQSELQVLGIAGRIAALKNAGLNVTPQTQLSSVSTTKTQTQTVGSSRKLRRRLPAPPTRDKEA